MAGQKPAWKLAGNGAKSNTADRSLLIIFSNRLFVVIRDYKTGYFLKLHLTLYGRSHRAEFEDELFCF